MLGEWREHKEVELPKYEVRMGCHPQLNLIADIEL